MTLYTQLRHAGYYQPDLTDKQRQAIHDEVVNGPAPTTTPKESTTSQTLSITDKPDEAGSKEVAKSVATAKGSK